MLNADFVEELAEEAMDIVATSMSDDEDVRWALNSGALR